MRTKQLLATLFAIGLTNTLLADEPAKVGGLDQPANSWVKRSPLKNGPRNPMLGYEGSFGYDPLARKVIRWAGHTQSGGHEQQNETWTYDPRTAQFELIDTNLAPPGGCCVQQNVFDPVGNRFLRFKSFAGSHGWQWFREIYLANSSVWSFDLATKTWRNMKPMPEPLVSPLRCASWDSDHQVVVVFGGEGNSEGTVVYDPYLNTWKRMNPKVQPAFRSGGNMAYDAKRKRHILFGSQFDDDKHTWAYSLTDNTWTDLKPKEMPPTKKNDAVLVYDERHGVIVANVNVFDSEVGGEATKGHYETWVLDGDANTWKKMSPAKEPDGFGSRRRLMCYVPDLNVTVLESYVNPPLRVAGVDREQQIWTYRYADAPAAKAYEQPEPKWLEPKLVEDVVCSVISAQKVSLKWKENKRAVGYVVERAAVEVFSEDQIHRLRKDTPPLAEPSIGALHTVGEFQTLTKKPVGVPSFEDSTIDLSKAQAVEGKPIFKHRFTKEQVNAEGKPYRFGVYAYRVREMAVNGDVGGPSPYVLTIPSAPQWLYSKESGNDALLKWAKNPEQGIVGYRVYRMESPRINGPGQKVTRVTAEPTAETTFTDKGIGKESRRYSIVAVDALGQEGIPSAPTWHYRLFKNVYDPFVGEWHQ